MVAKNISTSVSTTLQQSFYNSLKQLKISNLSNHNLQSMHRSKFGSVKKQSRTNLGAKTPITHTRRTLRSVPSTRACTNSFIWTKISQCCILTSTVRVTTRINRKLRWAWCLCTSIRVNRSIQTTWHHSRTTSFNRPSNSSKVIRSERSQIVTCMRSGAEKEQAKYTRWRSKELCWASHHSN